MVYMPGLAIIIPPTTSGHRAEPWGRRGAANGVPAPSSASAAPRWLP